MHIKNILQDNELDGNSVIKDYLITTYQEYEQFDYVRKQSKNVSRCGGFEGVVRIGNWSKK